ncbi:MAG: redox-sensing transcriptional repressor Rex [Dehalococcoidia bacterium]|nr:redox-sensing transcriptional repressor Rex [Dehalococcoidia bacterium]
MAKKASQEPVPEVVVMRLPLYLRALNLLEARVDIISSQDLGDALQLTPAQIRKDLSYFGKFGKQGRGYSVRTLVQELKRILGLDQEWKMVLVGVGRLGRAILDYARFTRSGFITVAAFDADSGMAGKKVAGVPVLHVSDLPSVVAREGISIGIVSVPPSHAQQVIDDLVHSGVKAILNYAPVAAKVPPGVNLRDIDPVLAAQSMTFYLSN